MTDELQKETPQPTGDKPSEPPTPAPAPVEPPPPAPKYEPPPENIQKQAQYLARDAAKGGKAAEQLFEELERLGMIQTNDPVASAADSERITKLERELAKRDAVLAYGLSSEDVRILDGTPDEIMAKAKYLSERIAKPAAPGNGQPPPVPPVKPEDNPPAPAEKIVAPAFTPIPAHPADIKEAQKQAQARINALIAKGEGFGPTRSG